MPTKLVPVDPQMLIPDLLRAAPQARPVLDRFGLHGCGGPLGPYETLGFFAKAHDVPLPRLLTELATAIVEQSPPTFAPLASPADTIYRPFFKAGIALVLTLGATWGAYLLWRIGLGSSYKAAGLHEINAHGHAQIFGWLGLFVMGFAYQAFPRFKHTKLAWPRLALVSLVSMLAGILLRSLGEPFVKLWDWTLYPATLGSVLELVAISIFVAVVLRTLYQPSKALEMYDWYIIFALGWFMVQAIAESVYFVATALTTDTKQLVLLVATWQGMIREMQIHGFGLLMVLGVSQRIFPYFFGMPMPSRTLSKYGLFALNVAILGECLGTMLMQAYSHAWAGLWYSSVLLMTVTVVLLVRDWKLFRPVVDSDRSLKFLRAAYVWLLISLSMAVLLPVYQFGLLPWLAPASTAQQMGFSHAFYGAIRHAITVGFLSLMIVGVAAKIVPTLNGLDLRRLSGLWGPFFLLNMGCALRVSLQTLTDFTSMAYPFVGISGVLEVTGLAWWGIHLWRIMNGRLRTDDLPDVLTPEAPITDRHRVGEVLDVHPQLLEVFLRYGFHPLSNPFLRQTAARWITLEQACRRMNVPLEELLAALNTARLPHRGKRMALPVLGA